MLSIIELPTDRSLDIFERIGMEDKKAFADLKSQYAIQRNELTELGNRQSDLRLWDETAADRPEETRKPLVAAIAALIRTTTKRSGEISAKQERKTQSMLKAELSKIGSVPLIDDDFVPKADKNRSSTQTVGRIDGDIFSHLQNRKTKIHAPRTAEELDEKIRRTVNYYAEKGRPNFDDAYQGGAIAFPRNVLSVRNGHRIESVPDGLAALAWLFPEQFADRLREEIAFKDRPGAMSVFDQREAIAKIDADLAQLHRERAALVEAIIAEGGQAFHRPDAPALAVLRLRRDDA